jgi:hypothetical protein
MCIDEKRVCKLNHNKLYNWLQTTFKYTVLYTSEHNSIAEWCWRTFCTMKNIMLLNVKLFNRFWIKIMNTVNYFKIDYQFMSESLFLRKSEQNWYLVLVMSEYLNFFCMFTYQRKMNQVRSKQT